MNKNSDNNLSFIQMACCVLSCNDSLSSVTISNKMELEEGVVLVSLFVILD